jgi:hypothetical protein
MSWPKIEGMEHTQSSDTKQKVRKSCRSETSKISHTADKLARKEMMKSGTVLKKQTVTSQIKPMVFFCASSRSELFMLCHIYRGVSRSLVDDEEERTISLGLGAKSIVVPFGCFDRKRWATMCAYGTAAMDANP